MVKGQGKALSGTNIAISRNIIPDKADSDKRWGRLLPGKAWAKKQTQIRKQKWLLITRPNACSKA